jgi:thioredoxin 1
MITNLTDENFDEEIKKLEKPVLVDFFATWCGPCEVLGPVLEKVAEGFGDKVVLAKVNVDQFPVTSGKFNIDRIPNVILFKDGKPVDSFIGLMPEPAIKTWLENALNKK